MIDSTLRQVEASAIFALNCGVLCVFPKELNHILLPNGSLNVLSKYTSKGSFKVVFNHPSTLAK